MKSIHRNRLPLVLFALLMAFFLEQKIDFNPTPVGHKRSDATFYYQIAQHVEAGEGLRTSVSLYNKGLRDLPAPTTIYPAWPLLLGWCGRLVGLDRAAWLVPECLFFLDLLLLYFLANRLGRAAGNSVLLRFRGWPILDLGLLAVLVLGTNTVFFDYTSTPWTEGLAFALLFGALLALPTRVEGWLLTRAALAGALGGLGYLARSQLIGLPLAIAAPLAIAGIRSPRCRAAALSAIAGATAVVVPWIAFLFSSMRHFEPRVLIDFTAYRETPELAVFRGFVETDGILERLLNIAGGVFHSFHPTARFTYVESFGPIAYVVPLAMGLLLVDWARRRVQVLERLQPSTWPLLGASLAALLALGPTHLLHMRFPFEWSFHWRHGLPLVLAIVLAVAYLSSRGRLWRFGITALLAAGLIFPQSTGHLVHGKASPGPAEVALLEWIDAHPEPPPVLLSIESRALAAWTRATAHWTRCDLDPEETRLHFRHLELDYLILYGRRERSCPFVRGLEGNLEIVRSFGRGPARIDVLRWHE